MQPFMQKNPDDTFQGLFYRYYAPIVSRLLPLVGQKATAEDITQEAFLRLYRDPPDDLTRVGAWLNRVAVNLAYDYLRHESVRSQRFALEKREAESSGNGVYPSNEDVAFANWELESVQRALDKLSERDRMALLLKEQGYSYIEIAERLDIQVSSVGTMLARAGDRLKKQYFTEEGIYS
ncbi:sigma-70 family RNA polymerase sigma factor [Gorillibacterium massiliense]|uniref:sigma-70 family RNA polymerase sigma factor n=1 Tax=Gorillibacterium massiliense TaxID=1280390 RepID=UPI0004AC8037|nr:sigma-70 family RNA polymerase sigma factor [Gorillibacterium massiliense]